MEGSAAKALRWASPVRGPEGWEGREGGQRPDHRGRRHPDEEFGCSLCVVKNKQIKVLSGLIKEG